VGIIRFLLAAAVVLGHAPGWGGVGLPPIINPLPHYFAVQAFFVISGFYMELLRKRYQSPQRQGAGGGLDLPRRREPQGRSSDGTRGVTRVTMLDGSRL
jgi:hypothetical protein